jgi:hypothetical protein
VFQIQRQREMVGGRVEQEVVYGVTSLTAEQANAARLLELNRGHWGIENRLFGVRDVTMGEDACRVRSGSAPQILAAARGALIHLLQGVHPRGFAAALRRFAAKPFEAIALLFKSVKH